MVLWTTASAEMFDIPVFGDQSADRTSWYFELSGAGYFTQSGVLLKLPGK